MSTIGFSTNAETLLVLAWLAVQPTLREELIQNHSQRRDNERLIRFRLLSALYPFVRDTVYGPAYQRLFEHRLEQVEFTYVDWAMRGYKAVYLGGNIPTTIQEGAGETRCSTEETALLWEAIEQNKRLHARLKRLSRAWDSDLRRGARILRMHFTLRMPLLMRTRECPFIVQELLCISLERVNWLELAALVLGVAYTPLHPLPGEEEEDEDLQALFAILTEAIWQGYVDFGAYSQQPWCSEDVQTLCLDLADHCHRTHQELRKLEETGRIYAE
jgi:hypothetical protein